MPEAVYDPTARAKALREAIIRSMSPEELAEFWQSYPMEATTMANPVHQGLNAHEFREHFLAHLAQNHLAAAATMILHATQEQLAAFTRDDLTRLVGAEDPELRTVGLQLMTLVPR